MAELKARFALDGEGKPKYIATGTLRHYVIDLFIEPAPEDAIGVTYQLDETYVNRLREAYDRSNGFREGITSYGDYDIVATVRTKPRPMRIRSSLYDALKRTYGEMSDPQILKALDDIKAN
jgi:hypothetical protein